MNKLVFYFFRAIDAINIKNILPDKIYLKIKYYKENGTKLDLSQPKTFSEKLQWLKLYDRKPLYTTLVDKYAVKQYVGKIIGEEYIIPTYGIWENFDDIDFSTLPKQFVLKCTHDSGSIVICKDKESFDFYNAKRILCKAMKRNYYWSGREWPYKNVKPQIIAEKFMSNYSDNDLTDYKIFCFNGQAKYCQVIANRHSNETIDFYDEDWIKLPFIGLTQYTQKVQHSQSVQCAPHNYRQMLHFASILSDNIPFARIDFYEIEGKLYFGEITFFPTGGTGHFEPDEWNYTIGDLIELPKQPVK